MDHMDQASSGNNAASGKTSRRAFTDLFIERPVLASVVSLLILLIGLEAATKLPIRQYPKLSNTTITITTAYPGANADLMKFSPQSGIAVPVAPHRLWLGTVGSVGQPRDGRPEAMYAVFDSARWNITFHRVPYDQFAAASAIRRAGLPEYFAQRLEKGR